TVPSALQLGLQRARQRHERDAVRGRLALVFYEVGLVALVRGLDSPLGTELSEGALDAGLDQLPCRPIAPQRPAESQLGGRSPVGLARAHLDRIFEPAGLELAFGNGAAFDGVRFDAFARFTAADRDNGSEGAASPE